MPRAQTLCRRPAPSPRLLALVLLLLLAAGSAPAEPARPAHLEPAAADSILMAIAKDRSDTETWLKSGTTWYLATIARVDFGERTSLTVGRAADNDVVLDDPAVALHHLRVSVVGDQFRVEGIDPEARFKVKEEEKQDATLDPSGIGVGRFLLRLSHQRFPAIIVFDPRSPRFKEYKGLKYFPVDLAYRFEVRLAPNPRPDTLTILSTRGNRRRAVRVGWFDFMVGETACRLEATRLLEPGVSETDVSIFFTDATSGKETYPVGRYVDVQKLQDGRYLLDFNNAYNPACAFSDHYNCPIPTKANALPVAIRAGEMNAHYHQQAGKP